MFGTPEEFWPTASDLAVDEAEAQAEAIYREWCYREQLDPEDTASAVAYEEHCEAIRDA